MRGCMPPDDMAGIGITGIGPNICIGCMPMPGAMPMGGMAVICGP